MGRDKNIIKSKSFIICFLFVAVFSLSTVFGVPIDEAQPKPLLDTDSAISEPLFKDFIEQTATTDSAFLYILFVSSTAFILFIRNYQSKIFVLLEQQLLLALAIVINANTYFLYLFQKKIIANKVILLSLNHRTDS